MRSLITFLGDLKVIEALGEAVEGGVRDQQVDDLVNDLIYLPHYLVFNAKIVPDDLN